MLTALPIKMGGIAGVALQTGFVSRCRSRFGRIGGARSAACGATVFSMFVAVPVAGRAIRGARVVEEPGALTVCSLDEGFHNCVMATPHAVSSNLSLLS